MSAPDPHDPRLQAEAAEWFAKLGQRAISSADLMAYREWRRVPAHRAAYEAVEAVWTASAALKSDPEIRAATEEARQSNKSGLGAPPVIARVRWTALAVLVVLGGAIALQVAQRGQTYATGPAEQRIITLQDGSRVRLDTRSQIRVRFTPQARDISLASGQALFEVAHDQTRPFTVSAGATQVRAVGTRFDVRRDGNAARVVLIEGVVEVRRAETRAPIRLQHGQALPAAATQPQTADLEAATDWTEGRIRFQATPLREAVAEVNRYSRQAIVLDAGTLNDAKVSGVFNAGDTQAFIGAVSDLFNLKAEPEWDGRIRLRPQG
ncbi:FecR family protein [Phenylobacterium aquaticum]|uniref:FecR family protein n=1 Tax=Phenylobacterium aquaticum TaxID=1763816 RepID=UPI001F5CEBA0|nr:FecR domain-containing protein [Phenylobacterium aquaticum]